MVSFIFMQAVEYMSFRVEEADRISIDPRSKTASIDTNGPDIPEASACR